MFIILTILPSLLASVSFWSQLSFVVIRCTFPPVNSTLWTESSPSFSDFKCHTRQILSIHALNPKYTQMHTLAYRCISRHQSSSQPCPGFLADKSGATLFLKMLFLLEHTNSRQSSSDFVHRHKDHKLSLPSFPLSSVSHFPFHNLLDQNCFQKAPDHSQLCHWYLKGSTLKKDPSFAGLKPWFLPRASQTI